jgi:LemA protein
MLWLWILIGVVVLFIILIIGGYNGLVRLRNEVRNSFSQIDVQLKRRNSLIPNLVNTVKGYAKHEKELFEKVTSLRNQMSNAGSVSEKAKVSGELSNTLKSLFAVVENYPDLKANQNFLMLQEELTGTEDKISYSRQHYNDIVMHYNTKIEVFPSNVIAGMFGFKQADLFEASEEERKDVKVSF